MLWLGLRQGRIRNRLRDRGRDAGVASVSCEIARKGTPGSARKMPWRALWVVDGKCELCRVG